MSQSDPTGKDWSALEIDLIVADYFMMLQAEMSGIAYVKTQHNAEIQRLTGRSRGSIEFKHQNISAVMVRLGLPWIEGYKPLANFQAALIDGIERFLARNQNQLVWADATEVTKRQEIRGGFLEEGSIFIGAAPLLIENDVSLPPAMTRLLRRFDPAERDAKNRQLGERGEERVLLHERSRLQQVGRFDLAKKIRWVSKEDGDGAGFDILSFSPEGRERFIEVKTTIGGLQTPFFITENERAFSDERPDAFRLMRLYDFARAPKGYELEPPLTTHVQLNPTLYRASFERG